jgi:hypothetical protein
MTSPAMRKLLGAKKKAPPRPITWIKVRRNAPYIRFVIPPCFVCDNETVDVVMYNCASGGARCLRCFSKMERGADEG